MSKEHAVAEVNRYSGTQLCPPAVDALIKAFEGNSSIETTKMG